MTIKGKKYKIVFRPGRPLTKVVLIAMITLCTIALVVIGSNVSKEKKRLKSAKATAVAQEQEKQDLTTKIDQLGSDDSIRDIAAEELGMYPEGTVIVDTE